MAEDDFIAASLRRQRGRLLEVKAEIEDIRASDQPNNLRVKLGRVEALIESTVKAIDDAVRAAAGERQAA